MRGEHMQKSWLRHKAMGSSPHARGARTEENHERRCAGIIPACAGSTRARSRLPRRLWDHPRMRGEHASTRGWGSPSLGSSPHARGARTRASPAPGRRGIIPACAGSTRASVSARRNRGDHPRMRGEHAYQIGLIPEGKGSSPHARGAQPGDFEALAPAGIIPACAGSTCPEHLRLRLQGDHPRMRGEHVVPVICAYNLMGSSPHARGAHRERFVGERRGGIIPACAGSTRGAAFRSQQLRDHPRMRGEHG